jgi:hypothetical protein
MATLFWLLFSAAAFWLLVKHILSFFKAPEEEHKPLIQIYFNRDLDKKYSIKGINLSGIDDSYLGDHDGTAKAITDNDYDPYAVAIYVGKKRVGWLPAGCVDVHKAIMELGGSIDVYVYIGKATDDDDGHEFYYGKVQLGL